jgi:hypothetical protein
VTLADEVEALVNKRPRWLYAGELRRSIRCRPELNAAELVEEVLCESLNIFRKTGIRITREGRGRVSLYRP